MFRQMVYGCLVLSLVLAPAWSAAEPAARAPKAYLPESVYAFETVVEGVPVVYEFILQNLGDETLHILDIKSG